MSQKKVDQYKKEKANRKKNVAKEKRNAILRTGAASVLLVAVICFLGFSIYKDYIYEEPAETETTIYSLSEKEVSSAWTAYEEQATSEEATTSAQDSTEEITSAEETTSAAE